jgi:hypothetical protein
MCGNFEKKNWESKGWGIKDGNLMKLLKLLG